MNTQYLSSSFHILSLNPLKLKKKNIFYCKCADTVVTTDSTVGNSTTTVVKLSYKFTIYL